jgi:3-methylcrotonyl-CoA carboxylase alpha subunit
MRRGSTGAEAIHPGYGFLSENADFADAVEAAGLVFIGPNAASMRKMGSKAGAKEPDGSRRCAGGAGLHRRRAGSRTAATRSRPHRLSADDQGRARRRRQGHAHRARAAEFAANLLSCQREARNAFGRDRVLLERYVETPRHIEIQIFGDAHGEAIHLNERECSAQRRYQKVIEESPSPFLTPSLRIAHGCGRGGGRRAIDYVNAGTVEFIVGPRAISISWKSTRACRSSIRSRRLVTGLDLVEWQLRVAAGEPCPCDRNRCCTRAATRSKCGCTPKTRNRDFLPGSGRITRLALPQA